MTEGDPLPDRPRRIHILGGEASGKTTLSRRLGVLLDLPVYNLDAVAWIVSDSDLEVLNPRYQPSAVVAPRPIDERRQLASDIAAGPAWISEGKYVGWTTPLLERAEIVVILDHVPTWRAVVHILARAARSSVRETRRRRGIGRFFRVRDYVRHGRELAGQLVRRLMYGVRRPADGEDDEPSRSAALASIVPFAAKVVHVRRAQEVDLLVERIAARLESPEPMAPRTVQ